jgi:hypothetical protein
MLCSRMQAFAKSYGTAVSTEATSGATETLTTTAASSKGRGTRAAGWFADHIAEHGDEEMKSLVLLEGIKGWATAGSEYTERMHEYNESIWAKVVDNPVR